LEVFSGGTVTWGAGIRHIFSALKRNPRTKFGETLSGFLSFSRPSGRTQANLGHRGPPPLNRQEQHRCKRSPRRHYFLFPGALKKISAHAHTVRCVGCAVGPWRVPPTTTQARLPLHAARRPFVGLHNKRGTARHLVAATINGACALKLEKRKDIGTWQRC